MTMTSGTEQLSTTPKAFGHGWTTIKAGLAKFGTMMLRLLAPTHEPVISQKRDRSGNLIWIIYEPDSNQTYSFTTEAEVRQWIDNCYYDKVMNATRADCASLIQQPDRANQRCQDAMQIETVRQQLEACFRRNDDVS